MGWLSGWNYRKKITIKQTNVDSNLSDFPLYVDITDDGDIGAHISDPVNGYDIRFTQSDGTTLLKYEREYFDVAASIATGHFWVKVPSILAASGAEIYIYYNDGDGTIDGEDAPNVWDSNFKGVWHLKETAGDAIDSTAGGNDGTFNGSLPTQVDGKIYKGQYLDGVGDFIDFGDVLRTAGSTFETGVIAIWFKPEGPWYNWNSIWDNIIDPNQWEMWIYDDGRVAARIGYPASTRVEYDLDNLEGPDYFYHIVFTWVKTGNKKLYVQGVLRDTKAVLWTVSGANVYFGGGHVDNTFAKGVMCEIRISNIERIAAWHKFEFHNVNADDNELIWSGEGVPSPEWTPRIIMIS